MGGRGDEDIRAPDATSCRSSSARSLPTWPPGRQRCGPAGAWSWPPGRALTSALLTAVSTASVVATDLNEAMVTAGSAREPRADWRQADAQELPFEDGTFDLLVCQFGGPAPVANQLQGEQVPGAAHVAAHGRVEESAVQGHADELHYGRLRIAPGAL